MLVGILKKIGASITVDKISFSYITKLVEIPLPNILRRPSIALLIREIVRTGSKYLLESLQRFLI